MTLQWGTDMLGYSLSLPLMMKLGPFKFGVRTAAYQETNRSTEYRWARQELHGQPEALQYIGPGAETLTIVGVIYPEHWSGTGQVDAMRAAASQGEPLIMVSGLGAVLGKWVIEKIDEKQSVFAGSGVPRKQEFTITLRRFGPPPTAAPAGVGNILGNLIRGVLGALL